MSGFFTRLAQRTLGTAQTIGPNIGSLFAQNLPENETINPIDETENRPTESNSDNFFSQNKKTALHKQENQAKSKQKNSPANLHAEQKNQNEPHTTAIHSVKDEALKPIDQAKPVDNSNEVIVTAKLPNKPQAQIDERVPSFGLDKTSFGSNHFLDKPSGDDSPLVPMPVDSIQDLENPVANFENVGHLSVKPSPIMPQQRIQNSEALKRQESESQTINVSIGRVEVRAVHPQPASVKMERAKTKSALSLEDYLQQRRKGER